MDSALYNVIGNVKIPKMARVRQKFDPSEITAPAAGIRGELSRPEIAATLKPRHEHSHNSRQPRHT